MKKVGEHVTIDFLGVKREYSPEFYTKVIYKIAKKARVEVLNIAEKVFKPQGYTCVALLAESHMSFHTFPERGIISFQRIIILPAPSDRAASISVSSIA